MRIAMISEHASPLAALGGVDSGGQNVYVCELAYGLAALGYEVDVFTRRDQPFRNGIIQLRDNLRVIHVPAGPPRFIRKEDMLPYMTEFTRYMYRYLQDMEKPYDIIHANFWMSGMVAMHLKHLLQIPFVITFHALGKVRRLHQQEADEFPDARLHVEEKIMREADGIIAECPQDETDMKEHYHVDPAKITMIPCGFNPSEFDPIPKRKARERLGWPQDEKIILQLGRIVPRKGIETVIRGFAKYKKNEDGPTRLIIVGGNSPSPDPEATPEIGRLQNIAQEEGVAHAVSFTGQMDRRLLGHCYSAADVFVTMPWYEPFGITPLEAMACGTPVIGSDVGGIKYTVKHGTTGFLVPSKNTDALAGCLREFFRNLEHDIHAMGQEAIKWVHQFTWHNMAKEISNLYQEVYAPYEYPSSVPG
jgi:D-inositol-3-phosphate glycosyltransferase